MFILLIISQNIQSQIYFLHFIEKSIYSYLKRARNQHYYYLFAIYLFVFDPRDILSSLNKSREKAGVSIYLDFRQRMSMITDRQQMFAKEKRERKARRAEQLENGKRLQNCYQIFQTIVTIEIGLKNPHVSNSINFFLHFHTIYV